MAFKHKIGSTTNFILKITNYFREIENLKEIYRADFRELAKESRKFRYSLLP